MSQRVPIRAALMITCLGDLFYAEVGVRIVRLLRGLGVGVDFPAGQTCCGLPLFNSGYRGEAATVARRTIPLFRDATHVVVPSGSCAWMVKHEYPGLMPDEASRAEARRLAERTWELSQFLVRVLGRTRFASAVRGRVTYHDSCHLLRGLGERESPRTILRNLEGVELVELPGSDECCGFGGSFSVRLPEVSTAILDKKLTSVESTGAGCVVACDAGCLLQMSGGLGRRGSGVRALHLAEILSEGATSQARPQGATAPSETSPSNQDCAGEARGSTTSEGTGRPLRHLTNSDGAGEARARTP